MLDGQVLKVGSVLVEFGQQVQEALGQRLLDKIVVHRPQFRRDVALTLVSERAANLVARCPEHHDLRARPVPWGQTLRSFAHGAVSRPVPGDHNKRGIPTRVSGKMYETAHFSKERSRTEGA